MNLFNKIFKPNKELTSTDLTTITRTEVLDGFSIPGIIHNMQYHFTDLQVYSDGLISCWEMVDLAMFKDKLNKGWVVTSVPNGGAFSIFSLGFWMIERGEWLHTKETLYEYVYSLVKKLNPALENLQNYNGSNSKMFGTLAVAKHSMPSPKPYYSEKPDSYFSKRINGEKFHILFREDNKTYLSELSLYKNGLVEITNIPTKKSFKFEDLKELATKGVIATEPRRGETIIISNLGSFKVVSGDSVNIQSKLNELTDKFNELNGNENTIRKCARIFEEYLHNPTKKLQLKLREAYEAIPEHQRIYVGTMDTKDYEVRLAIYGDIIKEEWKQHYGDEYPFGDIPTPTDED